MYVQRANDYRAITGEGFTFLNIPRTYYGLLDVAYLVSSANITEAEATKVFADLTAADLCDDVGTVDLGVYEAEGRKKLEQVCSDAPNSALVVKAVVSSLYRNMYLLLKESISEEMYITYGRKLVVCMHISTSTISTSTMVITSLLFLLP